MYVPSATDTLYFPWLSVDVATILVPPLSTVIPTDATAAPLAVTVPAIHPAVNVKVKLTQVVTTPLTSTPLWLELLYRGALALTVYVAGGSWTVYEPSAIVSFP